MSKPVILLHYHYKGSTIKSPQISQKSQGGSDLWSFSKAEIQNYKWSYNAKNQEKKKKALPEQPHLVFETGHMEWQSTGQTGVEKNFTPKSVL